MNCLIVVVVVNSEELWNATLRLDVDLCVSTVLLSFLNTSLLVESSVELKTKDVTTCSDSQLTCLDEALLCRGLNVQSNCWVNSDDECSWEQVHGTTFCVEESGDWRCRCLSSEPSKVSHCSWAEPVTCVEWNILDISERDAYSSNCSQICGCLLTLLTVHSNCCVNDWNANRDVE